MSLTGSLVLVHSALRSSLYAESRVRLDRKTDTTGPNVGSVTGTGDSCADLIGLPERRPEL
jgi:hypothetical protein